MPSPETIAKLHFGITLAIGVVAIISLARLFRPARGTTLMAVWAWSAMALFVATAVELTIARTAARVEKEPTHCVCGSDGDVLPARRAVGRSGRRIGPGN